MRQYEVTFIVDPVLSSDEVKATVETYQNHLKDAGAKIVHTEEIGLRQLAYPIKKRNTGVYFCIEFQCENGELIDPMELSFRRDERVLRFLVVKLDKYGVKYNEDKRNGLIGKVKKKEKKEDEKKEDRRGNRDRNDRRPRKDLRSKREEAPKEEAPKSDAAEKPAEAESTNDTQA